MCHRKDEEVNNPCNKFLLKKVCRVMVILKKLAKFIKIVFCNLSKSFIKTLPSLFIFVFFITILVSFYLRRFLLWDSSYLKVTEYDFKVVTLLLQGIFIRILIPINRPVINWNKWEGGKCAKNMRGRIWLLLQVSSPAALFPRVCWECVKRCQTVGDQLIIASYWGPG